MWLVPEALRLPQVADVGDGHDSLSEAHIISEQPVHVVCIEGCHPLESVELVWLEGAECTHLCRLAHVAQTIGQLARVNSPT